MRDLATCRFADDATNVLFVGPLGVGKTMLAIALGRATLAHASAISSDGLDQCR